MGGKLGKCGHMRNRGEEGLANVNIFKPDNNSCILRHCEALDFSTYVPDISPEISGKILLDVCQ